MNVTFNNMNFRANAQTFYSQVGKDFNPEQVAKALNVRAKSLPISLDRLFYSPSSYIAKRITIQDLVSSYLNYASLLYKRMTLGINSKLFAETYQPEIKAVKAITQSCSDLSALKIAKQQFDLKLEEALSEYTSKPVNRKVSLIV